MLKLRTEEVTGEAGQVHLDLAGDRMDLLINKQSFSANPRELKKQAESSNFLQGLNQYTQEEDMKHQMIEALMKEKQELRTEAEEKDKAIADLRIQLKYEKIQKWNLNNLLHKHHKRERGLLKRI